MCLDIIDSDIVNIFWMIDLILRIFIVFVMIVVVLFILVCYDDLRFMVIFYVFVVFMILCCLGNFGIVFFRRE